MLDVNNICRICLREEDPKLQIFIDNGEKTGSKLTLPEKIMSFAKVKVAKDDGLSSLICVKCYCQVDVTFEFIKLCEESFQFVTRQLERFAKHQEQENVQNEAVPKATPEKVSILKETLRNGIVSPNSKQTEQTEKSAQAEATPKNTPEKNSESDDRLTLQITSTAGNVQAWSDETEKIFVDPSIVKTEPHWGYDSNDEKLDDYDSNEENVDYDPFLDANTEKPQNESAVENEYSDSSICFSPTSGNESLKCRSCNVVFNSRKTLGIHINQAHRHCATCGKYFFSNKEKDGHVCKGPGKDQDNLAKSQFCKICKMNVRHMRKHRLTAKHKEAVAEIRRNVSRRSVEIRRRTRELMQDSEKNDSNIEVLNGETSVADSSTNTSEGGDKNEKIVCQLCDLVCSTIRGYKTHMTCTHRNYKIIYYCKFCPDRMFQNRPVCEKHYVKKHGGVDVDQIPYEYKPINEIVNTEDNEISSPENVRPRRGVPVSKFECLYCAKKFDNFAECQKHLLQVHKSSDAQKIRILREYVVGGSPTRLSEPSATPESQNSASETSQPISNLNGNDKTQDEDEVDDQSQEEDQSQDDDEEELNIEDNSDEAEDMEVENPTAPRQKRAYRKRNLSKDPLPQTKRKYLRSHPPFNPKMPVIANNFSIILDDYGVKEYRCNGCGCSYNRYISAYNHYYTLSKKFPMVEKKQLPDSKPFGCKICTLKFASRGQAVSHRLNSHKLFYSQLKAARRNQLIAQAETKRDFEVIEERLREF